MASESETTLFDEDPAEADFVEQAEYIQPGDFDVLNAEHPHEDAIVRKLTSGGAKLLVGPRGCGKTTLLLKAYYSSLSNSNGDVLPVYVNFKLSLKIEPFYASNPNARYWFEKWLILKIIEGLWASLIDSRRQAPRSLPQREDVRHALQQLEAGNSATQSVLLESLSIEKLKDLLNDCLEAYDLSRCILLLDDAAHAFSSRQQEDFFDFFRNVKTREISPKAAIYPGITTHSPHFHVGHDAEQIDVWVRPDDPNYIPFMRRLAQKRFRGQLPSIFEKSTDTLDLLAYASFGIPRSFLNMLRSVNSIERRTPGVVDRRRILEISRQSREYAHNVFDSLAYKIPAYSHFIATGGQVYQKIIGFIKEFNRPKEGFDQALRFGVMRPVSQELEKLFQFFQYAGLMMPVGETSRGEKGVFEVYGVHIGDLITENAIIARRTKSIDLFVRALSSKTHQAWPRLTPERLVARSEYRAKFRLSLPSCQSCGHERANENARFCHNCGAPLKTPSTYTRLVEQDISVLPISKKMAERIRRESGMKTVKDILMDTSRGRLRSVDYIGPIRAEMIARYAEEHVA